MYGSTGSRDLLAFLACTGQACGRRVWGLATLEVTSEAALDEAHQVARPGRGGGPLASAQSDLLVLRGDPRPQGQELRAAGARRARSRPVRGRGPRAGPGHRQRDVDRGLQRLPPGRGHVATEQPGCGLRWELLAAIGKTESNHGIGRLDAFGNSQIAIVGIPIGGDTDGGLLDGDSARDHAVGPMQFIPSTWKRWATGANGDGRSDPGNIVDAATAAGRYLCRAAGDLTLTTEPGSSGRSSPTTPTRPTCASSERFEALADDLAAGWFSAAALPPPPAARGGRGPQRRSRRSRRRWRCTRPPPPPPPTQVVEVKVFGPQDLATSTTAPLTIADGECLGPSLVLDGRDGFLRCRPRQEPRRPPSSIPASRRPMTAPSSDASRIRPVYRRCCGSTRPAPRRSELRLLPRRSGCSCSMAATAACPSRRGAPARATTGGRRRQPPGRWTRRRHHDEFGAPQPRRPPTSPPAGSRRRHRPRRRARRPRRLVPATTVASTTTAAPTTTVPIAERSTYTCVSGAVIVGLTRLLVADVDGDGAPGRVGRTAGCP